MDDKVPVDGQTAQDRPDLLTLISELRQRHLFRIAAAYAVGAWLIIQVVATVAPAFDLPPWVLRSVILAAIVGFLVTMGILLFRPRREGRRGNIYLSQRARLVAGSAVLLIAAVAGILSVRSFRAPEQVTIAVLPFADLSPTRDKAYFAEGVAEEILSSLASEQSIRVLGRTSARELERNPDPATVRASLGVTHLLEGSARSVGDQLRVNVRLIDTADGAELWEEKYDGRLSDVFRVQDEIASTVVKRLRGTFAGSGFAHTGETTSVNAYQTYLAARALMRDPKTEPLRQAHQMAQSIVRAHPDYALGHALLADTTMLLADGAFFYGDIPLDQARKVAVAEARKAVQLAPERAEGYAALGLALPAAQAVAPLEKAINLDRSWAALRGRMGIALDVLGRHDEAFEQYRLGVETDPLSSSLINRYVLYLGGSGREKEAFEAIAKFVERGGSEAQAWRFRGNVLGKLGDLSGAIAARRRGLALDPALPYQDEWVAMGLHFLGLDERASPHLARVSRYARLFLADDRGALKLAVAKDGAKAWSANGVDMAIFSLARARDWAAIARLYDLRPAEQRDQCLEEADVAPFMAMALDRQGRRSEAGQLLACLRSGLNKRLKMRFRSPDIVAGELEMGQASVLALKGDRAFLDWLDRAVAKGWLGQYYSSRLADWPQFDAFAGEPRLAAIQRRIDARIAAERAETAKLF